MKPKHLNKKTYSNNIRLKDLFDVRFRELKIIPSKSASREMSNLGLDISDCKHILEEGYKVTKRSKNIVERCFDKGSKTYKVVAGKSYNYTLKEEIYIIMHVGKISKKRGRKWY